MAPILTSSEETPGNSLSPTSRPNVSLQAAAATNAGLQRENSQGSLSSSLSGNNFNSLATHRPRRSSLLMNLQLNDPTLPAPGEMVAEQNVASCAMPTSPRSPIMIGRDHLHRHGRQPSLGEIHQEFEAETEAHVNRLLQIIRDQQLQLQQARAQGHLPRGVHDEDSMSITPLSATLPRSPVHQRIPSYTISPRLRSASITGESEQLGLGGRDESAFYQAETQMLTRENQMLRHRIRELERQLAELGGNVATAATAHEPFRESRLVHSTSVSGEEANGALPIAAEAGP